jgi:predicted NodU family carbamoyl transferase
VHDGHTAAAAEEEQTSRRKHHSGLRDNAVQYYLDESGISLDHVGQYWKRWIIGHKAVQAVKSPSISKEAFSARLDREVNQIGHRYLGMLGFPSLIRQRFGPSRFQSHYLEHPCATRPAPSTGQASTGRPY